MSASCFLLSIFMSFDHATCYWLSQNRMSWKQASTYCQNRCESHLGSFHDINDYLEVSHLINDSVAITNELSDNNIWIGLHHVSDEWMWSDSTLFDFGHNTSGGVFPWDIDPPSFIFEQWCVFISDTGLWANGNCAISSYGFICNECEGVLDKYILYRNETNYTEAANQCVVNLDSTLASVHNDDDHLSVSQLVGSSDEDTWIGLVRDDVAEWKWLDDTVFDYGSDVSGGVFPWATSDKADKLEPNNDDGNEDCVEHEGEGELTWKDDECYKLNHFICNKPSELCYDYQWKSFSSSNESILFHDCAASVGEDALAFITNKRWTDDNWPLKIEYTFAVHDYVVNENKKIGVVISEDENICESVFIGVDLLSDPELNTFYRLLLIMNGTPPIISSQLYLDNQLVSHFNFSSTNHYRYIGIKNTNTNITAKSLFISGTPQYAFDDTLYQCTSTAQSSVKPSPSSARLSKVSSTDLTTTSYMIVYTTFAVPYFKDAKLEEGLVMFILSGITVVIISCVVALIYIIIKLSGNKKQSKPPQIMPVKSQPHIDIVTKTATESNKNMTNHTPGSNIINVRLVMVGSAVRTKGADLPNSNDVGEASLSDGEESDSEDLYAANATTTATKGE